MRSLACARNAPPCSLVIPTWPLAASALRLRHDAHPHLRPGAPPSSPVSRHLSAATHRHRAGTSYEDLRFGRDGDRSFAHLGITLLLMRLGRRLWRRGVMPCRSAHGRGSSPVMGAACCLTLGVRLPQGSMSGPGCASLELGILGVAHGSSATSTMTSMSR